MGSASRDRKRLSILIFCACFGVCVCMCERVFYDAMPRLLCDKHEFIENARSNLWADKVTCDRFGHKLYVFRGKFSSRFDFASTDKIFLMIIHFFTNYVKSWVGQRGYIGKVYRIIFCVLSTCGKRWILILGKTRKNWRKNWENNLWVLWTVFSVIWVHWLLMTANIIPLMWTTIIT